MIQYLIILLSDTSTSYCHYKNTKDNHRLISIDNLKAGIRFAMIENLMVQYVLPNFELPIEYKEVMNSIDSHLFVPSTCEDENAIDAADVVIFNEWQELSSKSINDSQSYVLITSKVDFFEHYSMLGEVFENASRVNVVFTDVETFTESDFNRYEQSLGVISSILAREYEKNHFVQFNLLTDRVILDNMNNCGAGETNITLAPDGCFYVCPAFYHAGECGDSDDTQGIICQKGFSIGSLKEGLNIKNPQLYRIDHAPLCRICDAFQCKRCIWLNCKTTLEVNTPSHEQCVMAHIERNATRKFLADIRTKAAFFPDREINSIDYIDPFDILNRNY